MADDGELAEGQVLRLGSATRRFSVGEPKAMPADFRLSSADKKVVGEREAALTVWDRARTTPKQARALVSQGLLRHVYGLEVGEVRHLRYPGGPRLRIVRDLEAVADVLDSPGACGHCGIVGLRRPSGVPRRQARALESQLADLAVLVSARSEKG